MKIGLLNSVLLGATLLAFCPVQAQVTLDSSAELVSPDLTVDATELSGLSFDPTGSDKLVVVVCDEDSDNVTGITYDGKALTQAVYQQGGFYYTGIFYLDDPGSAIGSDSSGALVMTVNNGAGIGVSLLALSNTVAGVGPTAISATATVDLMVVVDDSFVVAGSNRNGGVLEALDPLEPLQGNADTGSNTSASGYLNEVASGTNTYSFTDGARLTVAAAFAPDVADTIAPVIVDTAPADDSGDVLTDIGQFTVTFGEPITAGAGTISLKKTVGDTTVASYALGSAPELSFGALSLTITPGILLEPATEYYIDIPSGAVLDAASNTTAYGSAAWNFTTGPVLTKRAESEADSDSYTFASALDLDGFDPSSSDKLVVHVSSRGAAPVSSVSVTFAGSSLTEAVASDSGDGGSFAGIYYLDNPPAAGDLAITFDSSRLGVAVCLYALQGTADDVGFTASARGSGAVDLYTGADNSFVIASNVFDGSGGSTAAAPMLAVLDTTVADNASHGSGYQIVSPAGPVSPSFPDAPVGTGTVTVAAGFELDTGDLIAPAFAGSTPSNGDTGLGIFRPVLALDFSENVKPGTGSITLHRADTSVAKVFDVNSDSVSFAGTTVTVALGNLEYDTGYYVEIGASAITDLVNLAYDTSSLTLAFSTATKADGTLVVDMTQAAEDEANQSTYTFTTADLDGFDPTSSDKLVVSVSSEGAAAVTSLSATYGGTPMNVVVSENSSTGFGHHAAILYLDNPTTSGDLVIDHGGVARSGVAVSALALTNTVAGVAVTAPASLSSSTTLTTNADGSLVFAANVFNAGSGSIPQAPLVTVMSLENGTASHGSGYQLVTASGTEVIPTFSGGAVTLAAAFASIGGDVGVNTFAEWISGFDVGGESGINDDYDNDGLGNALENLMGTSPEVFNPGLTSVSASGGDLVFRHTLSSTPASDLTGSYEWSANLVDWNASGASVGGTTVTFGTPVVITPGTPDLVEVTASITGTRAAAIFARYKATQN